MFGTTVHCCGDESSWSPTCQRNQGGGCLFGRFQWATPGQRALGRPAYRAHPAALRAWFRATRWQAWHHMMYNLGTVLCTYSIRVLYLPDRTCSCKAKQVRQVLYRYC